MYFHTFLPLVVPFLKKQFPSLILILLPTLFEKKYLQFSVL